MADLLARTLGGTLDRASRSSRARRAVESLPPTRRMVRRFVPGETTPEAVDAVAGLAAAGRTVTIDVLGEHVTDPAGAAATRAAYLDLLRALADADLAHGTDVSVKLSALGQALADGDRVSLEHAHAICAAAADVGATVTLDMEDHTTTDATLAAGVALRADFAWVGNVLQTNLLRTPGDVDALTAVPGARIRLVKGAYREPASVAHERKADVDRAYAEAIAAMMPAPCYPMIATHDPAMLALAERAAADAGRARADWETQMLFGVRTDLQQRCVDEGGRLRVYLPYGTDWYGYFMRRLAERPANVAFFLRALAHR